MNKIVPLLIAETIANEFLLELTSVIYRYLIVGSIRRRDTRVTDIDLVIIPKSYSEFWALINHLLELSTIEKGAKWGNKHRSLTYKNLNIEIYTATPENYGYITWLRTGPAESTQFIMTKLSKHKSSVRFSGGSAWHVDYNSLHPNYDSKLGYAKLAQLRVESEGAFFQLIGLPYIEPTQRNNISYGTLNRAVKNPPLQVLQQKFYIEETKPIKQLSLL